MSRDHIDRVAGELWFIFGEHTDGSGCVDVSDGHADVFERIPRDKAERLIKLRSEFLAAVRAEYEGTAEPPAAAPPGREPCAECGHERAVHHADGVCAHNGEHFECPCSGFDFMPADQPWRGPPATAGVGYAGGSSTHGGGGEGSVQGPVGGGGGAGSWRGPPAAVRTLGAYTPDEEPDAPAVCGVVFFHPRQSLSTHCRAGAPGHAGPHVNPYDQPEACTCHNDLTDGQPHAPDCPAFSP